MNSQNNTPNLHKNDQASIEYRRIVYRHGPIPESRELANYERLLPGAADRILAMAEKQHQSIITLSKLEWFVDFLGMLLGRSFLYLLVVVSYILVMHDKEVAALLTGLAPIVSIIISTFRNPDSTE